MKCSRGDACVQQGKTLTESSFDAFGLRKDGTTRYDAMCRKCRNAIRKEKRKEGKQQEGKQKAKQATIFDERDLGESWDVRLSTVYVTAASFSCQHLIESKKQ